MRKIILPLLAILLIGGCKKEDSKNDLASNPNHPNLSSKVTYTAKKDINVASVKPEALQYYKNIAHIANWYAKHRKFGKMQDDSTSTDTGNTLLSKLQDIVILDSNNVEKSFFDLGDDEIVEFLASWSLIQANDLSLKLTLDTSGMSISLIDERNDIFNQLFGMNKMSDNEDPYWKLRHAMDLKENNKKTNLIAHTANKTMDSQSDFYASLYANQILAGLPVNGAPLHLPHQTFVDRIRTSLQPGRLLIALPGGSNTLWPIVFYPNSQYYDPGHVAIINVNYWDVPTYTNPQTIISIGTTSSLGMHKEFIEEAWSGRHGLAYVGQVYTTRWITQWVNQRFGWWTVKVPTYVQEARDVDNNAMLNEAYALMGKPYCYPYEVMTAKWAAPARFICSTTAWWCAKKSAGVNIGDFYKSTIFPAGVYLSDRVRIERSTLR